MSAPTLSGIGIPVFVRGCEICFGTGRYFAKPGELKDCPNGCQKPQAATAEQHRPHSAYGCSGCSCSPVACENGACCCACCCYRNYPLPAVGVLALCGGVR